MLRTLVLIILFSPAICLAETVELAGVEFSVQEYKRIDSSSFKISVLGKPKIVEKENVNSEIIRQFFASWDKTKNLGIDKITDFCVRSLTEKNTDWALTAFDAMALTFADSQIETVASLKSILIRSENDKEFLQKILLLQSSTQYRADLMAALLFFMAEINSEWLKENKAVEVHKYREQIKSFAEAIVLENISNNNITQANNQNTVLKKLYSNSDPVFKRLGSIINASSKTIKAFEASPEAAKTAVLALRKEAAFSADSEKAIVSLAHVYTEKALAENQGRKALEYLSLVKIANRSPKTHEQAIEALKLAKTQKGIYLSPETQAFLQKIVSYDEEIKNEYFSFLESEFQHYLDAKEPQKAETQLEKIQELRPDPNSANDRLRVSLAMLYLDQGLKSAAKDRVRDIKTGISFLTRLQLILSGLYIPTAVLLFLLAVPLLGTISYLIRTRTKQKRKQERLEREAYDRMVDEEEQSKLKGFNPSPRRQIDPLQKEYEELLAEFGLRGKVSLRQIKSAYRKLAKRAHPDMKPGKESEEFLRIKKNYEKIKSLRRKLAID